jgi:NADH dehydrogenase [ubiquinone] 1 alpha subcomplex assembly factor 1
MVRRRSASTVATHDAGTRLPWAARWEVEIVRGIPSLDNNGGFASVRSRPRALGAPGAVTYVLEVRGDGKRYKLNLPTDDAFNGVNYQAAFETPRDQWTTVRLPVAESRATFRGRVVAASCAALPASISRANTGRRSAGPMSAALRAISSGNALSM